MLERAGLSGHLCGLDFVARAAAPSCEVREDLALLTLHTRLHLTPPLLGYNGGVDTGRHGASGTSNLSREAGTLDGLRSLLDLVFVTAAMGSDHLTCPRLHVHCVAPVCMCEGRQTEGQQETPHTYSTNARTPFPHSVGVVWSRSALQVDLSPHSRSAIRHGGQAGIPRSKTIQRPTRAHAHQRALQELEKFYHCHPLPRSGHRETKPRTEMNPTRWLLLSKKRSSQSSAPLPLCGLAQDLEAET